MTLVQARLVHAADVEGFRRQARALLHAGIEPDRVAWQVEAGGDDAAADLFDACAAARADDLPQPDAATPAVRVPAAFAQLCDAGLLHRSPQRHALLYRLLWRLRHEPGLRHDPLDPQMRQARELARAVQRDIHKMRAFVRFTALPDGRHVAWFEPAHHVVEANAGFFARRFAQMRWAILTPDRCIEWDGSRLQLRPGADRTEKPAPDAGEALWLTYYEHIFNPARLKVAAMVREMPRRYWPQLPEATLIRPLIDTAAGRAGAMVDAGATPARRFRPIVPLRAAVPAHLPRTLEELRVATDACRDCPIGAGATRAVCGSGPLQAAHMLVGEQPGDQEDLAGRPFVGPAGQLLDRALAELGWPRDAIYLANAVKHFKYELRGKRRIHKTAGQREAAACLHWLEREIELVQPRSLVALGATAARALLGRPVAVQGERGRWLHERADGLPVLVTWHPSALLRLPPPQQSAAWAQWLNDLAAARQAA
ncbi:MAG: DUF4130 domain-containing protein [Aquabacterium sp.]|nr:MAG: DUF4130 domain-containing protein [Aquabacterium sp.]